MAEDETNKMESEQPTTGSDVPQDDVQGYSDPPIGGGGGGGGIVSPKEPTEEQDPSLMSDPPIGGGGGGGGAA